MHPPLVGVLAVSWTGVDLEDGGLPRGGGCAPINGSCVELLCLKPVGADDRFVDGGLGGTESMHCLLLQGMGWMWLPSKSASEGTPHGGSNAVADRSSLMQGAAGGHGVHQCLITEAALVYSNENHIIGGVRRDGRLPFGSVSQQQSGCGRVGSHRLCANFELSVGVALCQGFHGRLLFCRDLAAVAGGGKMVHLARHLFLRGRLLLLVGEIVEKPHAAFDNTGSLHVAVIPLQPQPTSGVKSGGVGLVGSGDTREKFLGSALLHRRLAEATETLGSGTVAAVLRHDAVVAGLQIHPEFAPFAGSASPHVGGATTCLPENGDIVTGGLRLFRGLGEEQLLPLVGCSVLQRNRRRVRHVEFHVLLAEQPCLDTRCHAAIAVALGVLRQVYEHLVAHFQHREAVDNFLLLGGLRLPNALQHGQVSIGCRGL